MVAAQNRVIAGTTDDSVDDTQTLLRLRIRSSICIIYIEFRRYLLQKYVKDGSFM